MNITLTLMLVLSIANSHIYCMYGTCPPGVMRYNCADFTRDAVLAVRAAGCGTGIMGDNSSCIVYPILGWHGHIYHAWLGLEINGTLYNIEPIEGSLVYPDSVVYRRGRRGVVRGIV